MKNLKSIGIYALALGMGLSVACTKKTPKELIVNDWKVSGLKWAETDVPDSLTNEIVGKTTIDFKNDGKYEYKGEDATIQSGSYAISDDGKTFTLTPSAGGPQVNTIKSLTDKQLVFVDQGGNEFTAED